MIRLELERKLPIETPRFGGPFNIVWSSDSRRVASLSNNGNLITVYDRDGKIVREILRTGSFFIGDGLGFLDNNRQILMPPDRAIQDSVLLSAIDIETGEFVRDLPGPQSSEPRLNQVYKIAVSPDQKLIAVVVGGIAFAAPVRLYSADDWGSVSVLNESVHSDSGRLVDVSDLAFSADSGRLAIARGDGSFAVYDRASHRIIRVVDAFTRYFTSIAAISISPNGQFVAVGAALTGAMWHHADGSMARPNEGELTVVAPSDSIRIYRVSDGDIVASMPGFQRPISSIQWDPKDRFVAFISWDQRVHFWDWRRPETLERDGSPEILGTALSFSPDGTCLAVSEDTKVLLYKITPK